MIDIEPATRPDEVTDRPRLRWALTSARVLAGTAVAAGFVLAVGTLAAVPLPAHEGAALAVAAEPTPSDSIAVCPGPLLAAGRSQGDPTALGSAAAPQLVAATGSGAAPASVPLTGPAADQAPTAYVVPPQGRDIVEIAAASSAAVEADDLRGFAAASCSVPLFESWLVAGSAATGAADLVVLANPGAVAATATITVYGAGGPTTAPGGTDVVVAPGAQRVVPLAGLSLGEATPVVEVTADGAPLAVSLQSSITRTLLPGGVEQTSAVAAPAAEVVVPGLVVPDGLTGASDPTSRVRILAPAADGTATVTLARVDGGAAPDPQAVPLVAGVPVEADLGALAPGVWVVTITADTPVTAAAWQTTGLAEGADFAWLEAAPALAHPTLVAVAPGPSPTLVLSNPSAAPVTVAVTGGGSTQQLVVPPAGAASTPVAAGSVLSLDAGGGAVHAAIVYAGPGALSGYPVAIGDTAAAAVTVYP